MTGCAPVFNENRQSEHIAIHSHHKCIKENLRKKIDQIYRIFNPKTRNSEKFCKFSWKIMRNNKMENWRKLKRCSYIRSHARIRHKIAEKRSWLVNTACHFNDVDVIAECFFFALTLISHNILYMVLCCAVPCCEFLCRVKNEMQPNFTLKRIHLKCIIIFSNWTCDACVRARARLSVCINAESIEKLSTNRFSCSGVVLVYIARRWLN